MNKKALTLLLALALCACAPLALAATANASIVAPETGKIVAPFSGTLLPFDLTAGDSVGAGQTLFTMDTIPVYAAQNGTAAAVFAQVGDDAAGVCAYYGALAVVEPEHPLFVAASTDQAYDRDENRYIHAGETLYLKCGDEEGVGLVTSVSGSEYVVQILSGGFEPRDTVRCFRSSDMASKSETGRGRATRYPDAQVTAVGRIAAVYVAPGDSVKTGDLLFEVIDPQAERGVSAEIVSPMAGAITRLAAVSGAQVYRGQLLCEVADLTALELSAQVDEIDLGGVKVGDTLSYTLDAYPDEVFSGVVTQIRPIGEARQNATYFDVRLTAPQGRTLLPGMNGTVTLN